MGASSRNGTRIFVIEYCLSISSFVLCKDRKRWHQEIPFK